MEEPGLLAEADAACRIRVRGCVQGVGFRPFVWQLAQRLGVSGEVANDGEGVTISARASAPVLRRFAAALRAEAPPLARVAAVEVLPCAADAIADGFAIAASTGSVARTGIAPDAATCPACLAEILDPDERRRGYPFTNCTHCGPRLSIIAAVPYDRCHTSMADFAMCSDCAGEYADPADRRFHAQPIACAACGPRLTLEADEAGAGDPLDAAAAMLRAGRILAVKGLGGYHLACLAGDPDAVALLRQRKARDDKPFAVMVPSLGAARSLCEVSEDAAELLASAAAPIVLVPRRAGCPLPEALAPGLDRLGLMLPYTPLHHLLLRAVGGPLVMTSGNLSNEPQVIDDAEARARLAGLADGLLLHDRRILNRLDDSVVAPTSGGAMVLRRGRGMAPAPLRLPEALDCPQQVLAMGGDLKATFCLLRGREAVVSQHFGDLADAPALADYRSMIELYRGLYDFAPEVIVIDGHPEYFSSRLGLALGSELGVPVLRAGHHHAHMASCLAENGHAPDRLALSLICDGLGMGEDGTLWGGEVLLGSYDRAERLGALPAVALAGGAAAMKQPWRNLVAHVDAACGSEWGEGLADLSAHLPEPGHLGLLRQAIASGVNCPPCSSAGRLFDAVAAALGLHAGAISYEGQAAIALEALARPHWHQAQPYCVEITPGPVARPDLGGLWQGMARDLAHGIDRGTIAARFHATFVAAMIALVESAGAATGTPVALSGGVMQNALVREGLLEGLGERGLQPLVQRDFPAGDGGLSLGQAAIAAAQIRAGQV